MSELPIRVPERIGVGLSVLMFGIPAMLLWIATAFLVPALVARGREPLSAWFLAGGTLVFGPLLAAALVGAFLATRRHTLATMLEHLRVRPMSAHDWRLAGVVLLITVAAMAGLQAINANFWPGLPAHPPFMTVQPLAPTQYYILALWLPFFAANIIGEELWWRGFIQPRQEPVFGNGTWAMQGLLHGAFHFSFGPAGTVGSRARQWRQGAGAGDRAADCGEVRHLVRVLQLAAWQNCLSERTDSP